MSQRIIARELLRLIAILLVSAALGVAQEYRDGCREWSPIVKVFGRISHLKTDRDQDDFTNGQAPLKMRFRI